ncbi:MAG TPA: type IX secretion system plug protein domain-containing protein, partial [Bacteroidales bacterium]|nr:type IX secretion system plug protein domain-containing protein [Bacteroidales bacterium]
MNIRLQIRITFISTVLLLSFFSCRSYASLPNENLVYDLNIHTVLMYKKGFEMSMPVMRLTNDDGLILSFDDLDGDLKRYKYTIIHCESDWKTSEEIRQSDYINGYGEDEIEQYDYSYNTLVKYTHYSL